MTSEEQTVEIDAAASPRHLQWPDLCANCGGAPAERLPVTKVFERRNRFRTRSADDPLKFAVTRMNVPFCASCASRHRHLAVAPSLLRHVGSFLPTIFLVPAAISAAGTWLFFHPLVLEAAGGTVAVGPNSKQFAFLAFVGLWSAFFVWFNTRRFRVAPPTEITRAFDFDHQRGNVFSRRRRTYRLRNRAFAEAFRAANPP